MRREICRTLKLLDGEIEAFITLLWIKGCFRIYMGALKY